MKKYTEQEAIQISDALERNMSDADWEKMKGDLTSHIFEHYKHFIAVGGGLLQPECRMIANTYHALEELGLELNGNNLFMAANAMQGFVMDRFGYVPFPGAPDYELYRSFKGAAYIMNKILLYAEEGWDAISDY